MLFFICCFPEQIYEVIRICSYVMVFFNLWMIFWGWLQEDYCNLSMLNFVGCMSFILFLSEEQLSWCCMHCYCNLKLHMPRPFLVSFQDESVLIWISGKEEKYLKLSHVSRIIPGQRTVSLSLSSFSALFLIRVLVIVSTKD